VSFLLYFNFQGNFFVAIVNFEMYEQWDILKIFFYFNKKTTSYLSYVNRIFKLKFTYTFSFVLHVFLFSEMAGGSKLQNLGEKKKVDEEKCLLCLKRPMDDKATIHCGHSFCFSCLKESAEANNPNVLCPLCKTRFQVIWHQDGKAKYVVTLNILGE